MPEQGAADRTEKPTQERLRKARKEGQIAQSRELPSAVMITALLIALSLAGPGLYQWFLRQTRGGLSLQFPGPMSVESFQNAMVVTGTQALTALMPFLIAAAAASVLGSLLVGGWTFAPKAVQFKLSRMNPVRGMKNLVSLRSWMTLLVSLAKMVALSLIVYLFLRDRLGVLAGLQSAAPGHAVGEMARLVFGLTVRVTIALAAIAAIDVLFQKWKYLKDLRMTRQEVKEERRQYEASPEVRARVRTIQIQMARKRMIQDVPRADVVIANPTHVAVALKYDPATMAAPQILAKGAEMVCQKIKEVARKHGVPIVHRPELARAIYGTVEVGQAIPDTLFVAVAEVLAMIYRLRKRRGGERGRKHRDHGTRDTSRRR